MKASKQMYILSAVLILAAALPLSAATTATLSLSGVVPAVLEISVTPELVASNLPITTTVSDLAVATVLERSNKKAGYTVSLESASAKARGTALPAFVSAESSDVLSYSISYDGNAVSFSSGSAVVSSEKTRTGMSGISRAVTVSFDGASAFLDESTYSDTLTFTISAK